MLTMRAAAQLLAESRSFSGLAALCGSWLDPRRGDLSDADGASPVAMDAATRDALGLDRVVRAGLVGRAGSLRVLVAELPRGSALRDELARIARRLASRAPHVLWLVAVVEAGGAHAAIAGWTQGDGPGAPRLRLSCFAWEPERVVDSDAETLCALAAIEHAVDVDAHLRALEILGREALTRRFYDALAARVASLAAEVPASPVDARALALHYVTRLLFLAFLEAKSWLDGDRAYLANRFDACMRERGGFHGRVLLPLFFGTLNTPPAQRAPAATRLGRVPFLNGGLFTRTALERRVPRFRFSDERIGELLQQLLLRYRFVAREDSAEWSEASVDPEMLGRAFESLMQTDERRAGGVFYTPHVLVASVAERALEVLGGSRGLADLPLSRVRDLRVLDPACGSGAFLVYMLERLAALRRALGDATDLATLRRDVLARSIFGVDRSPTAVWLCELRLWLSVVIESGEPDALRVPPLPNLDRNIRTGDALAGAGFTGALAALAGGSRLVTLRQRYVRATGARKQSLARAIDRAERTRALTQTDREIEAARFARRELLDLQRSPDLFGERRATPGARREQQRLRERLRALRAERRRIADGGALPFSFDVCFADAQARGGFDLVLGNPPWVRLHRIPIALRLRLRDAFAVYRSAAWCAGMAGGRVSAGFGSQVDLAALFVERSVGLLRDRGVLSLLLPVKLWRSLAGGGVRSLLARHTRVMRIEDYSEARRAFDAAVYPSLLVAAIGGSESDVAVRVSDRGGTREWTLPRAALPFDDTPGAPWLLLGAAERRAFDAVQRAGVPLATTRFGAPRLGVKSGCNAAFIVRAQPVSDALARITDADGENGLVERALLRPALRGETLLHQGGIDAPRDWILWTHDATGAPLDRLPERARAWLRRRYAALSSRSDARGGRRWWALFRTDAAVNTSPRVVWADFGRRPAATVLSTHDPTVPLNSCYVVRCADDADAAALAALLRSRIAAAWLNALAEPARGGYRRYLGWTVGLLPIPREWTRARASLHEMTHAGDDDLDEAVLGAYGLARGVVAPLVAMVEARCAS